MTGEQLTYPFEHDVRLDLDPEYERLRANEPVARVCLAGGADVWLVTRYDDIKSVLSDPRFRRSYDPGDARQPIAALKKGARRSPALLPIADPPEHTRLRRLVTKAFTVHRIDAMRPYVQQTCDNLLDAIEQTGTPADLVRGLALPMPVLTIAGLLGVPAVDLDQMRDWVSAMLSSTGRSPEDIAAAKARFSRYMEDVVDERTVSPGDDLISELIRVRDEGDRLDREELLTLIMLLFVAGHETTMFQIAHFLYTLLTHPEQWAQLRDEPAMLRQGIEELLRYVPLGFGGVPLTAAEDVELAGTTIRAGESVILPKSSGNRDASVFDHPDELDFHRPPTAHLAFGHGAHFCLGAQLARMELQVAVGTVVRRFPKMRLAVPDEQLAWRSGSLMRGLVALPVEW